MHTKTIAARLAALEALDNAQTTAPAYVCIHPLDWAAYIDVTTPADVRQAIARAYQLTAGQSWFSICDCAPPEQCRVCADQPVSGDYYAT